MEPDRTMTSMRKRLSSEKGKSKIDSLGTKSKYYSGLRSSLDLGSPILIVVSVICRDQCIYYLYR